MLKRGWEAYKKVDPGISLVGNALAVVTGVSGVIAYIALWWDWFWQTFSWGGLAIAFLAAWVVLTTGILLAGLGRALWRGWKIRPPAAVEADEPIAAPPQASPPTLQAGLYVGEIRFTFADLKKDRHSELTMRVFNGTGRVIELRDISGQIKFAAPNSKDPATTGTLPTPALRSDTIRTAAPLTEWFLIFSQPVKSTEADKLLAMKKAGAQILFDLSDLKIQIGGRDKPTSIVPLPLWSGFSYASEVGFGRIVSATVNLIGVQISSVRRCPQGLGRMVSLRHHLLTNQRK